MPALIRLLLASLIVALLATPVRADVTAIYRESGNPRAELRFEVAESGAIRISQSGDGYLLILDGEAYFVSAGPGGPEAMSGAALAYVERQRRRRGEVVVVSSAGANRAEAITFARQDAVTVMGLPGVLYRIGENEERGLVLSEDSALRPLGTAISAWFLAISTFSPEPSLEYEALAGFIGSRGVLAFGGLQLASLDRAAIDPARFALPVEPVRLADVVDEDAEQAGAPDDAARFRQSVIKAAYSGGALYTLDMQGTLRAWAEGASVGTPVDAPGPVRTFCANSGMLYLVTAASDRELGLWAGMHGAWRRITRLQVSQRDPFHALDCSGAEPLVVTSRSLFWPLSGRRQTIEFEPGRPPGYPTTLQHGGYLYVGINAGEWGGGLRRFALSDGGGEAIEDRDPEELCGGQLNAACVPVTGLAPDQAHPECVLVASGLAHLASSGSVVRVCGTRIETVYAKPFTLETDWRFDPANPPERYSSVPFYSLGIGRVGVWAVASDGIYLFGAAAEPEFTRFAREQRFPAGTVDWSNPDFVLISTSMNQRHSVSGASLILVPRQ